MASEAQNGMLSNLEVGFGRIDKPSLVTALNYYDCVPATLVNTTAVMGFSLVDQSFQRLGLTSLRKLLDWPDVPNYVDIYSVLPILNKLPPIVSGEANASLLATKVVGGRQPRFLLHDTDVTAEQFLSDLAAHILKGKGVILGFGDYADHATVWAPTRIEQADFQIIHIDSLRNPPLAGTFTKDQFIDHVRRNAQKANPNGEHPIVFQLDTRRIVSLRNYAQNLNP